MFILDTRGREESVDQLIDELKKEIVASEIDVSGMENLGRRDFARTTDVNLPAGNYVEFTIAGSAGAATRLRERFRLNRAVYRVLVQSV